ncbi:acyloxyacyl hydrolase [Flavobacterium sp.]|uniref:acyloxyacyl hydrolase n=1 Tax=Flavobacterium sp. TaxID=239 RepID=UPI00286DF3E2|nr:acyloxyacyl hydrolase [Flavobacterium sp.]
MILKKIFLLFIFIICFKTEAQKSDLATRKNFNFIGLGYSVGKTLPSISIFPDTKNQKSFDLTIGNTTYENQTWAKLLNYPKSGFLLSYADFGNPKQVGYGISVIPFLEFGVMNSFTKRVRFQLGLGGSYNNVIYDKVTNRGNFGISTHFNWAFRSFIYYDIIQKKDFSIKLGAGLTHFSNGHTRLPNHGLNSILSTIKTEFNFVKNKNIVPLYTSEISKFETDNYFSTRFGFGQKVLARDYNNIKNVYTASFAVGKVKNKTYKYGVGFYFRFYEDYYDYIKQNGAIINKEFSELKNKPFQNSTAVGVFSNFELLMNHFSVETELGLNIYKPGYKFDWYLNNGSLKNGVYVVKNQNFNAKLKQIISSRLGFRYYAFDTKKAPIHNFFVAANINANLGQADFSELSFGYVYSYKSIKNK